jgi:hypothetical protein
MFNFWYRVWLVGVAILALVTLWFSIKMDLEQKAKLEARFQAIENKQSQWLDNILHTGRDSVCDFCGCDCCGQKCPVKPKQE